MPGSDWITSKYRDTRQEVLEVGRRGHYHPVALHARKTGLRDRELTGRSIAICPGWKTHFHSIREPTCTPRCSKMLRCQISCSAGGMSTASNILAHSSQSGSAYLCDSSVHESGVDRTVALHRQKSFTRESSSSSSFENGSGG